MAENSAIEWTHHTFNPWSGCTKVSEGCAHCYAAVNYSVKMRGVKWGPQGNRIVKAESGWKEPLKWDRAAKAAGERHRVFCASLADVFEDWQGPMLGVDEKTLARLCYNGREFWARQVNEHEPALTMSDVRERLFKLIDATPNLDWLVLTKRPENIADMMPPYVLNHNADGQGHDETGVRENLWLGVSVENQDATWRIGELLKVQAAVRFLSCEPLLGPVNVAVPWEGEQTNPTVQVDWCIVGCESRGKKVGRLNGALSPAEPHHEDVWRNWAGQIVCQCQLADVPPFVKQVPINGRVSHDPSEWPADLRVREFPEVAHV